MRASASRGLAASGWLAVVTATVTTAQAGTPPICSPGGGAQGYRGALETPATKVGLDGSGSWSEPGTTLRYRWEVIAGSGAIDDPAAMRPVLSMATPDPCRVYDATVKLTVNDGTMDVSCFAGVKAVASPDCPVELVVVMDTSSSMYDDATAICTNLGTAIADLDRQGIHVAAEMMGITSTAPSTVFTCLTTSVKAKYADPRARTTEDWGPAVSIVAERQAWTPARVRLVIPVSDEGPSEGDPCNDPGSDRDAITAAIASANANHVLVSPIAASGATSCVQRLSHDLATATRGTAFLSSDPADLVEGIANQVRSACLAARPVSCAIQPVADLSCAAPGMSVALDGSGSSVSCATGAYLWTSDCPGASFDDASAARPTLRFDGRGAGCSFQCKASLLVAEGARTASCTQVIRVHDDRPPALGAVPFDGACLWPPDHRYWCVDDLSQVLETSDCSAVKLSVTGCASDQPDDVQGDGGGDDGDGHTSADCKVVSGGKGFCVRAERLGGEPAGRHYTISIEAEDGCGNATLRAATIRVPHDHSGGERDCLRANR